MARIEHILCPVDFSASSLTALDYASSLAQQADAFGSTASHVVRGARCPVLTLRN